MFDDDPLPDGVPLFDAVREVTSGNEAALRARFGDGALLVQSSELKQPSVLARTQSGVEGGTTRDVRVLLLPLVKRPDRNVFPYLCIGRTRNNDVVIMDSTISKFHAFLRNDDGQLTLQDAGSKNGTYAGDDAVPRRGEGPPLVIEGRRELRFGSVGATLIPVDALKKFLLGFALR